jgi:hypothetical protein
MEGKQGGTLAPGDAPKMWCEKSARNFLLLFLFCFFRGQEWRPSKHHFKGVVWKRRKKRAHQRGVKWEQGGGGGEEGGYEEDKGLKKMNVQVRREKQARGKGERKIEYGLWKQEVQGGKPNAGKKRELCWCFCVPATHTLLGASQETFANHTWEGGVRQCTL